MSNKTNNDDMLHDDIFNEDNKVQLKFFKFEKIGDKVSGIYVTREVRDSKLRDNTKQVIYGLYQPETDEILYIGGRGSGAVLAITALDSIPFGNMVGLKFASEGEAKKGQHPPKIIEVFNAGPRAEIYSEFVKNHSSV